MPYGLVLLIGASIAFPFWMNLDASPVRTPKFTRDLLGMYFILSGTATAVLWTKVDPLQIRLAALVWTVSVLAVVLYSLWVQYAPRILWIPSLFGLVVLHRLSSLQIPVYPQWILVLNILVLSSGVILCLHMLLSGSDYRNDPEILILFHRRYKALLFILAIRLVWDLGFILVAGTEDDYGIRLPLYRFLLENELRASLVYALSAWFLPLPVMGILVFWGKSIYGGVRRWSEFVFILIFSFSLVTGGYFLLNYGYVL
ncbi:MAG: hypothetical protein GXO90_01495 [FCB group bacterium]|nr:hypothetical protein [FCB group bacterium]